MLSGSDEAVYNEEVAWVVKLKMLVTGIVKNYPQVKLVGICFGHQMVASALGGFVSKMSLPEKEPCIFRPETITLTKGFSSCGFVEKMCKGIKSLQLVEVHGDQVEQVPPGCELYGWSKSCKVECFGREGRVLCWQAHPEFNLFFSYHKLLVGDHEKGLVSDEFFERTAQHLRD